MNDHVPLRKALDKEQVRFSILNPARETAAMTLALRALRKFSSYSYLSNFHTPTFREVPTP